MGMRLLLIFSLTLLVLICGDMFQVFSEVPTTPKILFTSSRDGNSDIYMMNPDGSEPVNLTQHPASDMSAVWSPTGDQILFVSDRQGTRVRDLYVMNPDGSNVRRVFKKKITDWRTSPTWSPDGKKFAYISTDRIRIKSGLYLGTFGEEDAELLPYGNFPAWSPDGSEIACSEPHQFGSRLTFINVRTRDREQPIPDKTLRWQRHPSWSAGGDKLAISGNKHPLPVVLDRALHNAWADKYGIYIVNRDGTGLRQLVKEAGSDARLPVLSPDGSEVVYTQEINGHYQIFKIDVNSGVRTQLTHVGWNADADWFDPTYALPVSPQPALLSTTWGEMKKK
ncbi:hypothetical protein F4009_12355 [Candidatus Poribacteria bacterium]|nr:hypothetical protein [Candidatus Poribacteria bacterium]MYH82729.1 hypothetical protein [Candidatus Poribacteria bacterium]MYK94765.1 hypothetical protein [Candidatus Poribacteria bacterium]